MHLSDGAVVVQLQRLIRQPRKEIEHARIEVLSLRQDARWTRGYSQTPLTPVLLIVRLRSTAAILVCERACSCQKTVGRPVLK